MHIELVRLRRASLAAGLSACLLLLAAASASASTTIGQNGAGGAGTCGAGTFIQTATGPGVPSYVVPPGGGVMTSWSFLAGSSTVEQDKLKVVRPTGTANQFLVVGEGQLETMTPNALNTFSVQIPVQAGDLLGLYTADGNDCIVSTKTIGNTDAYVLGADPPPGTTFTGTPESSGQREAYNISATVEPNGGDNTQDKCVGVTGSVQGCPKADLSIAKAASASSVLRGGTVIYTLTARNNGPDATPNVVVTDALASGAAVVSATASSGSCVSAPVVRCEVGTLGSGSAATIKLVVRMTSLGPKADTATVDSATLGAAAQNAPGAGDPNAANNSASTTTSVVGVANATQAHKTWREPRNPKRATVTRKRPPVGTTFRFTLSGPLRVRLEFMQSVPGRRMHGKCVARTNGNKHKHACLRTVTRGSLGFTGHAGVNTVKFQGRVSASKKLKTGKYTLVIAATKPGLGSSSTRLTFRIVT